MAGVTRVGQQDLLTLLIRSTTEEYQGGGDGCIVRLPSATPRVYRTKLILVAALNEPRHQIDGQGQNHRIERERKQAVNPHQSPQSLRGDLDIRDL